jgi:hypothetical protein
MGRLGVPSESEGHSTGHHTLCETLVEIMVLETFNFNMILLLYFVLFATLANRVGLSEG